MSDNAYINDLEERNAELRRELTAANATIAEAMKAGFIDAEGRVRKVLETLPVTEDGYVIGLNSEVFVLEKGERGMYPSPAHTRFPVCGTEKWVACYSSRDAAAAAKEAR